MFRLWRREEGVALPIVLVFVFMFMILSAAFMDNAFLEAKIAFNQKNSVQAYYIAEAGLDIGIAALRRDFTFGLAEGQDLTGELNGGHYIVTFETVSESKRRVLSEGRYDSALVKVAVDLELAPLYRQEQVLLERVDLEDVVINGDLHVNGQLEIRGSNKGAVINGNFTYTDKKRLNIGSGSYLKLNNAYYNTTYTHSDQIPDDLQVAVQLLPSVDFESFLAEAKKNPMCSLVIHEGSAIWSEAPASTKNLVRGNLHIDATQNDFVFDGIIFVDGYLHFEGIFNSEEENEDNTMIFIAKGDIIVDIVSDRGEDFSPETEIFFYSGQEVRITSSMLCDPWKLRGIVLAERVVFNRGTFTYDTGVVGVYDDYIPGFGTVISHWSRE